MGPIQSYAQSHGGFIELVGVSDDGIVYVKMQGTCAHCPLADVTLQLGLLKNLKEAVPGVKRLERV